MISGEIQDWQISASSTYPQEWDKACHERFARLYQPNGRGWCAKYKTSSEWLLVDLGVAAKVSLDGSIDWFSDLQINWYIERRVHRINTSAEQTH